MARGRKSSSVSLDEKISKQKEKNDPNYAKKQQDELLAKLKKENPIIEKPRPSFMREL